MKRELMKPAVSVRNAIYGIVGLLGTTGVVLAGTVENAGHFTLLPVFVFFVIKWAAGEFAYEAAMHQWRMSIEHHEAKSADNAIRGRPLLVNPLSETTRKAV